MTNFVTEAKRLGIPAPFGASFAEDGDYIVAWPGRYTEAIREDRLCVDQCADCRDFRNQVREAQAEEATRLADFEREEFHAVEAAVELQDHLNLLPATRLSELARDSLNVAIGLAHAAFDEARANGGYLDTSDPGLDALIAAFSGDDSPFDFEADLEDDFPY